MGDFSIRGRPCSLANSSVPIDQNETEPLLFQVALAYKNGMLVGRVSVGYRATDRIRLVSSEIRTT